jgi:CBS domain containing-hemolysin-like protein
MSDTGDSTTAKPAEGAPRRGLVERVRSAFGFKREANQRSDLEGALAKDTDDPAESFTPQERAMLRNILGLREVRVADVMVPRADIVAVEADTSLADLIGIFREAAHSRLPVYRETLDDPLGFIHIRDFLAYLTRGAPLKPGSGRRKKGVVDLGRIDLEAPIVASKIVRRVLFVPPSMPALDLLAQMQSTRVHMALVIDEYGGTDGLVSIEDLIEEVVGDIEDEHDEDEVAVVATPDGWVASARASLEEVRAALAPGLALETPEEITDEIDTIGGFLVTIAGRVPARGELIRGPGEVEFEVLDADPRRVKRIRIRKARPVEESARPRPARRREKGEAAVATADTLPPPDAAPPSPAPPGEGTAPKA